MGHTKHHMKAKHHRAHGGRTHGREIYEGKGSHVAHEAEEMKRGGHAHHKHGGHVKGHKGHHRIHKKRGGGVEGGPGLKHGKKGADHNPFSSAYTPASEAE